MRANEGEAKAKTPRRGGKGYAAKTEKAKESDAKTSSVSASSSGASVSLADQVQHLQAMTIQTAQVTLATADSVRVLQSIVTTAFTIFGTPSSVMLFLL
eukprot:CAMPEP_0206425072 /NCGR_PEP_ID=MMETSP0324_2-20121206/3587_1 /ASSEMBLY_ACC=CAM_ASM_000836 /TAXON_ID=2866 /ORGANISM="Crypthecodinium cohnii, Strain Seligo" /LENGTH=98 /DNA_ID=CAMNT_0053889811 /DNA_START=327 /DNA_END=619 /DNA_ORIENTATION=-